MLLPYYKYDVVFECDDMDRVETLTDLVMLVVTHIYNGGLKNDNN